MNYIMFENAFKSYPVFSVRDIRKRFTDFDSRRLVEWQQKGYLAKVRRGYYCFEGQQKGEYFSYIAANKIYAPSYISLESALSYYNLIPEGVFMTTSVTTRNTANYDTSVGDFVYRHIKPSLYFGYRLIRNQDYTVRMAEPEKVILDYFYLNKIGGAEDVEGFRINEYALQELIEPVKLTRYQQMFNSIALDKRIQIFLNVMNVKSKRIKTIFP
jgi:predicted transcriptional regulator of viral defense system